MRTETKIALTVLLLAGLYLFTDTVANTDLLVLGSLFDSLAYITLVAASIIVIWISAMIVMSALEKMKDGPRRNRGKGRRFL
jgi:hypothetical protein